LIVFNDLLCDFVLHILVSCSSLRSAPLEGGGAAGRRRAAPVLLVLRPPPAPPRKKTEARKEKRKGGLAERGRGKRNEDKYFSGGLAERGEDKCAKEIGKIRRIGEIRGNERKTRKARNKRNNNKTKETCIKIRNNKIKINTILKKAKKQ